MKKFSFISLVQFVLFALFVGFANGVPDESTQQLVPSFTVTSEDISSVQNSNTTSDSIIPRVLKKAKGSAKKSKASKSGKKVSKSSKALAIASPSQLSDQLADQQSSQPSSSPTVDPCVAEGISTQKDALFALKDEFTNGNTVLIKWESDTDPCDGDSSSWGGIITCNISGEVVAIDLTNLGLTGTISLLIGCPTTTLVSSLTILTFLENSLIGNIPTEIGMLTNLEILDFGSNSLDGNIPTELGNLINLTNLYFDNNNLDGSMPSEICTLRDNADPFLAVLYADCAEPDPEVICDSSCCTFCP